LDLEIENEFEEIQVQILKNQKFIEAPRSEKDQLAKDQGLDP